VYECGIRLNIKLSIKDILIALDMLYTVCCNKSNLVEFAFDYIF